MDHFVDKELARWPHLKGCGQWLNIQVERDVPQGSESGLVLFSIIVNDMDSGIECTLSKFADDSMMCGVIDILEGRDAEGT